MITVFIVRLNNAQAAVAANLLMSYGFDSEQANRLSSLGGRATMDESDVTDFAVHMQRLGYKVVWA